jgi:hypothetical protein
MTTMSTEQEKPDAASRPPTGGAAPAEPGPWQAFCGRHAGDPRLEHDPLYALHQQLIDALARKPRPLLSAADRRFEQDLEQTTGGGGFFRGRPFPEPFFPGPGLTAPTTEGGRRADEAVRDMLDQTMGPRQHAEFERGMDDQREQTSLRLRAYVMWLLEEENFREERAALQSDRGHLVEAAGVFPRLPRSRLGERSTPARHDPSWGFILFYRRWSLDTFITWDLPCPVHPELLGAVTLDTFSASQAGVVLFVPWSLLRDQHLDLHVLAERLRALKSPDHLKGWCDPLATKGVSSRYERLGYRLAIYRYLHLVLHRRYGDALRGNIGRVENALAAFLGVDTETVRKMRQALNVKVPLTP